MEPLILMIAFSMACIAIVWSMSTARRVRGLQRLVELRITDPSPATNSATGVETTSTASASSAMTELPVAPADSKRRRIDAPELPEPTLIQVPDLAYFGSVEQAAAAAAELSSRFQTIWAMAEAGESAAIISTRLGRPVGQVELILGLRDEIASSTARRVPQEPQS
ncbi:MAG: hypothetical protein SFX72_08635 [Isosphaeraceae bacterium]|nr:hypothetical protein [Isosphaeraceae bacterium]